MKQVGRSQKGAGILLASLLSACTATPSVKYWSSPTEDDRGYIKFYLSSTDITLSLRPTASTKNENNLKAGADLGDTRTTIVVDEAQIGATIENGVKVMLTPTEHRKTLYAIVPQDTGLTRTALSVTFFEATHTASLIKEIGSEVQDNRVKAISAIGGIAGAVGGIIGLVEPPPRTKPAAITFPVSIDGYAAMNGAWRPLPNNDGWWYRLAVEKPHRVSSVPADVFFRKHSVEGGSSTSVFPFSACTAATLHIKFERDVSRLQADLAGDATFQITLANPDRVDTLQLPMKGTIKMHPVCGADLTTDKGTAISAWDLIEELVKQVKSIKDKQSKK